MLALAHGIKGLFYEHYYSIRNMEFSGNYYMVDGIAIDKSASGYTATVTEYKLEQNYPNPFNPTI